MKKITYSLLGLLAFSWFTLYPAQAQSGSQIYHNFTGYSFVEGHGQDALLNRFTVMVVEDGRIVATGDSGLLNLVTDTRKIDLGGLYVLPGLIDAHGHVAGLGKHLFEANLRGVTSRTAAVAAVANYADTHLELPWVIGRGWNQVLWPDQQFPHKQELDDIISDRPVWLTRIDGHAAWVNSVALEIAEITADTPDPEGGKIIRDEQGQPTGVLIDTAMNLVREHMPAITEKQIHYYLDAAFEHLLSEGITQVHDAGVTFDEIKVYKQLAEDQAMIRIHALISARDSHLDELLEQGPYRSDNDLLQVRAVKIFGDGALGSRGAALLEPYSDDPDKTGLLVTPEDKVWSLFQQVHHSGFQIGYHAIGDRTNRLALDVFESLFSEDHEYFRQARHRIEHAQILNLEDIPRLRQLHVIPSMQPTHATSDMNMAEDRLGEERLQGAYAWRSFLDQGSLIAAGSDFPVELSNPFYGIHAAVTRQNKAAEPQGGWHKEQAMTVAEALRSFTIDAAYAGHFDDVSGSLEPGKHADFIVIDKDPFAIAEKDLWKMNVIATYIHGKRKYMFQP